MDQTPPPPPPPSGPTVEHDQPCINCNYNLRGLPHDFGCPSCGTPVKRSLPFPAPGLPPIVTRDQPCIRCSYNLQGLPSSGNCPECGTPVERSLRGDMLIDSSPDYLAALHKGAFWILFSIAGYLILLIAGIFVGFGRGVGAFGGSAEVISFVLKLLELGVVGASVFGYWRFTEPDPSQLSTNRGQKPRRFIRIAVVIGGASALLRALLQLAGLVSGYGMLANNNPTGGDVALAVFLLLTLIVGVLSFFAWIVQYFAAMLYLRWLTPRIPNTTLAARAKTYLWLIPVVFVVGFPCLGLGPLITMVLYYNMLNAIRLDLRRLRVQQQSLP